MLEFDPPGVCVKWSLSPRRLAAGVAGLVIGLGGGLTLAAPAQAQNVEQDNGRVLVDCQTQVYEVDRSGLNDPEPHAWRAVLRDDAGDLLRVLWQSGDWEEDADLGTDLDALVDNGWTISGSFEVVADVADIPNGYITVEYWNHNPTSSGTAKGWAKYGAFPRVKWEYEEPCGRVGQPVVTEPTCDTPATIEIPATHPEDTPPKGPLTYTINGEVVEPGVHELPPGTYHVVAHRVGGKKDYGKEWEIVITPPDCDEPTPPPSSEQPTPGPSEPASPSPSPTPGLPVTGAQTGVIAGAAIALLTLGGGIYLLARRRRITFTS